MEAANPPDAVKLVVADDEEGLLFLMVDALRREGFQVNGFETGADALEWLKHESADLLLVDLKLVDLPAPVLVQKLREMERETPYIVITGHGDERTAVQVMKEGALDYVMKESGLLDLLPPIVRRALGVVERERKLAKANADIALREERLEKVVRTALDGFVRCDREWRILDVNAAICELLGYKSKELLRLKFSNLEPGLSDAQASERAGRLERDGAARWFSRLRRRVGGELEVEVSMRSDVGEYFGFIHDFSEQRRLEREVLQIGEEERRRFGHELHDGLGQQLTAIELMSHTLARQLKADASALGKAADEIAAFTRQTVAQARRLAHGLAPVGLEEGGLAAALLKLAKVTSSAGVKTDFEGDSQARVADITTSTHLYRIAQEAVNNSLKHSKAKHIVLRLAETAEGIVLGVEDNGRGLAKGTGKKAGIGLDVMRHRARLIGAQLSIDSPGGKGVRITCTVPKLTQ